MVENGEPSYLFEWPESERLKKVVYGEAPKLEHRYTMPGVKSDALVEDPLAITAEQLLGKTIVRPAVPSNKEGLRTLIASGHLRSAVNLTNKLLNDLGQGYGMTGQPSKNTFQTFEVWACRFQLLMALKLYNLLNDELSAFEELDAPDLFLQYYPNLYGNRKGTLVSFSLRLVHAESLRFSPFPWAAIQRINTLEENVSKVINSLKERRSSSEHLRVWKQRLVAVEQTRARTLFFLKEYNLSMMLYSRIRSNEESEERRLALKLLLARIAAVVGDEQSVSRFLKELPLVPGKEKDVQLHRSLKYVFYGQYNKALEALKSNVMPPEDSKVWNNAAVCTLYAGRVNEALKIFQKYYNSPNEPLVLNYVSVNELTSRDIKQQKASFFEQNVELLPDTFNPTIFKLTS